MTIEDALEKLKGINVPDNLNCYLVQLTTYSKGALAYAVAVGRCLHWLERDIAEEPKSGSKKKYQGLAAFLADEMPDLTRRATVKTRSGERAEIRLNTQGGCYLAIARAWAADASRFANCPTTNTAYDITREVEVDPKTLPKDLGASEKPERPKRIPAPKEERYPLSIEQVVELGGSTARPATAVARAQGPGGVVPMLLTADPRTGQVEAEKFGRYWRLPERPRRPRTLAR